MKVHLKTSGVLSARTKELNIFVELTDKEIMDAQNYGKNDIKVTTEKGVSFIIPVWNFYKWFENM